MLLALDAGNTNFTFGVFDGETLRAHWRIRNQPGRTADEYASFLQPLFTQNGLRFADITGFIAASVVPQTNTDIERLGQRYFQEKPLMVSASLDLGVKVAYQPPTDVGADRLADAAAAIHKYGPAPLIFVDFGTATSFNAIAEGGVYLGGALCPGVSVAWEAFFARAARLFRVETVRPPSAIAGGTIHALQSGMLFGLVAQVDGMVERFRAELKAPNCPVIATGGHITDLIASESKTITVVDPLLTLEGLRIVHEKNR
ncbi:MAG TPA: type III pantothenate kinase [Capsulimonadaceae bacterium]|nr:type III pantothenate kinase [Capsulimonadaceae bacterium]